MFKIIDAHIHFDLYTEAEQIRLINSLKKNNIQNLISVSNHLQSAEKNLLLATKYREVKPAFGYHPEQALPNEKELNHLYAFIEKHQDDMIAIGEVGLPYYLSRKQPDINLAAYIDLLEQFIVKAKEYDKPIILHTIYDDAEVTCDLLEKHAIKKAHFHWFKGKAKTVQRIINNGYHISITPDVLYKEAIKEIVKQVPLQQLMVETDGPWQFESIYEEMITEPKMIHDTIKQISKLKREDIQTIYKVLYSNTVEFYNLHKC